MINEKLVTPKLEVIYGSLTKPHSQYKDYYIVCRLDPENSDHRKLMEIVKGYLEQARQIFKKKKLNVFIKKDEDENGEETGYYVLKAKSKYPIKFVNSQNSEIDPMDLPGGSVCRLGLNIRSYEAGGNRGITAKLNAVQVISIGNGLGSGGFDFPVEEDVSPLEEEAIAQESDGDDAGDF